MKLPKVAVLDDYQAAAPAYADWEQVRSRAQVTFFRDHLADAEAVVARLAEFDAVCFMRERTPLVAWQIDALPRLRLIVTTAMGNASIDVAHAQARGITVSGTESLFNGTPELVWALILGLARRLPEDCGSLRSGGWQTGVGKDLEGSTLGILGLGRVGTRVARVANAFGMQVIAWSPNMTPQRAAEHSARFVPRADLFAHSDFLAVCMQLRAATSGLVTAQDMARMKPSAYLINTSRGALVNEGALVKALKEGRIAGAGLDAHEVEPLPPQHPFRTLTNVLATPHIGYVTENNYRLYHGQTVEAVQAWLDGAPVRQLQVQLFGT